MCIRDRICKEGNHGCQKFGKHRVGIVKIRFLKLFISLWKEFIIEFSVRDRSAFVNILFFYLYYVDWYGFVLYTFTFYLFQFWHSCLYVHYNLVVPSNLGLSLFHAPSLNHDFTNPFLSFRVYYPTFTFGFTP